MKLSNDLSLSRTARETTTGKQIQERTETTWKDGIIPSEMQSALKLGLQVAQRVSEAREARVEALRAQINAGTYQVDSQMLAERMLLNNHRLFNGV